MWVDRMWDFIMLADLSFNHFLPFPVNCVWQQQTNPFMHGITRAAFTRVDWLVSSTCLCLCM